MAKAIMVLEGVERDIAPVLTHEGYDVVEVGTAEEAIRFFVTLGKRFDLVVIDTVPVHWGLLDTIRQIREREPAIPILVASTSSDTEDVVSALETGADDYVTKPFSGAVIATRVRALLRRRD